MARREEAGHGLGRARDPAALGRLIHQASLVLGGATVLVTASPWVADAQRAPRDRRQQAVTGDATPHPLPTIDPTIRGLSRAQTTATAAARSAVCAQVAADMRPAGVPDARKAGRS